MKLTLAILFGGRATEHDVSIISGLQAASNADPAKYDVLPIYIDRQGDWFIGDALKNIDFYKNIDKQSIVHVLPMAENGKLQLIAYPSEKRQFMAQSKKLVAQADVVMPVMHGMNGEDGTLQGMLELWNVPYTSAGVLGSSVGMDKIAMKQLFRGCSFPVLPDTWVERSEWKVHRSAALNRIEQMLSYPLFVKPANLGSSIGISRANDRKELEDAIEIAVGYDRRVLIEKAVSDLAEVNCSVLGYANEVQASVLEMPTRWEEFLTFDEKYMRGSKGGSKGMQSLSRKIPAPISEEMTQQIQRLSCDIFRTLDCKGVVRIDFLIDQNNNNFYVGEINCIPGSLAFYLWEATDLKFPDLIDKMVEYALLANADRNQSVFSYDSNILNKLASGQKTGGAKG